MQSIKYKSRRRCVNVRWNLTVGLTITGNTVYSLFGFLDPGVDQPVDGLGYRNNPLQSCSVQKLELVQLNLPTSQYQVFSLTTTHSNERQSSPAIPQLISLSYFHPPLIPLILWGSITKEIIKNSIIRLHRLTALFL